MTNKENGKTWTECVCVCTCVRTDQQLVMMSLCLSPCDQAGGDSGPGDAAGIGLLALLLFVFVAAAQTAQVDGETQQVEAEPRSRQAGQEYERLQRGGERKQGMNEVKYKVTRFF